MENGYIKEGKEVKEKTEKEKEAELLISILNAKKDLENACKNYEFAEGNLIDYYLYEIKASQFKLDYLIRKAKEIGIQKEAITTLILKRKKVV